MSAPQIIIALWLASTIGGSLWLAWCSRGSQPLGWVGYRGRGPLSFGPWPVFRWMTLSAIAFAATCEALLLTWGGFWS